jgi:hypothetical protein
MSNESLAKQKKELLKAKLRGGEYGNVQHLKNDIIDELNQISLSLCQRMIEKIPENLKLVIDNGGNQKQK